LLWHTTIPNLFFCAVPFDKITDCDVTEPAGNSCICVRNVLSTVNIDTASSGTDGRKELQLTGLKEPHLFKKLVWAMKRKERTQSDRSGSIRAEESEGIASLLREIRDELRVNNEMLQRGGSSE